MHENIYRLLLGDVADSLPYFALADSKLTSIKNERILTTDGLSVPAAIDLNLKRADEAFSLLGRRPDIWIPDPPDLVDIEEIALLWPAIRQTRKYIIAWQAKRQREKLGPIGDC
ncbi:MAG TPA: hypothetical protein VMR45_05450 [Patescibacteria group bacterium]|nr:hypothetical protein [Patescibacteria group bacterium]